ncbi:MAG: phenylalanine--tRNA ligase subunit beta [Campylobacterota bacterium]
MIVTRSWLNEWIDLSDIQTSQICQKLNSLGLEVDGVQSFVVPKNIVVGKVLSCKKHPDADKLNVCEVDVGTAGKRQIVCGAKNVVDAQYVAVAMIGAVLPNGLEIKHTTLRGVDSEGMICSSSELGLVKMNDGIMQLDASIGKLEIGKELKEYPLFCDDVIEIDLTPNRGDCLSIYGVARDLGAAFGKELKRADDVELKDSIGIGKILSFVYDDIDGVNMHYKVAQLKDLQLPFALDLRLCEIGQQEGSDIEKFLHYATHESGVVLNAYDFNFFGDQKATLQLKQDTFVELKSDEKVASKTGIVQAKEAKPKSDKIIIEASYIAPEKIVPLVATHKLQTDTYYFKTSRGSEPNVDFGMDVVTKLLAKYSSSTIYSGSSTLYAKSHKRSVSIHLNEVEKLIGQSVDKTEVSNILKHLGFSIQNSDRDTFGIIVPPFRHDIVNMQDITEEIVRMVGIDNIQPQRLAFKEHNRINSTIDRYRFKRELKQKAVANGYFEVMTYLFTQNSTLTKYGFDTVKESLAIVNPIASDMDGLRSTMLINMLEATQRNFNYGKKRVQLFEVGTVFDQNRIEKEQISFVFSGQSSDDNVSNSGKPQEIGYKEFIDSISAVVGDFTLKACSVTNGLIHPYQSADIVKDNQVIGYLSKLHPKTEYEVGTTYIATLDLDPLLPHKKEASEISKYQAMSRDLSVLIPKQMPYEQVKALLDELEIENLQSFYPVDIYEDKSLKDQKSLSLRFMIQSMDKTLQDEDLDLIMDVILKHLSDKAGATLR